MDMTKQQRKFLLACGAIVVGFYVIGSIQTSMQRAAFQRQQAIVAAQRQKAKELAQAKALAAAQAKAQAAALKAAAPSAPAPSTAAPGAPAGAPPNRLGAPSPSPAPAVTTLSNLSGVWRGRGALTGRGVCTLNLELRETPETPGHYSGYSSLACVNAPALMPGASRASAIRNRMNPAAAILTGTPENGSIRFHVDKTVGTDAEGCAATSFTATPFGTNRITAEWQEGSCQGGEILLARAGK